MGEQAEVTQWYRMIPVDRHTWQLWRIELVGRRIGKKRLLMESSPSVIKANWRALSENVEWTK